MGPWFLVLVKKFVQDDPTSELRRSLWNASIEDVGRAPEDSHSLSRRTVVTRNEGPMAPELTAYGWVRPMSPVTKQGLSTMPTVEDQARDALISHVRTRNGGDHGQSGEFPPGFRKVAVVDFIEVEGETEGAIRPPALSGRNGH